MKELWEIANGFRFWVCSELRLLSKQERTTLRGDYLFIVDENPRFIVMVDEQGAWSVSLLHTPDLAFEVDADCPFHITVEEIRNCILHTARTTITTDSSTLQKLLLGKLKAKVAFLTSKVELNGDLAAFLKMVTLLKRSGVKPLASDVNNYAVKI
ncbi:MAG: SCP2 sterol-binding domain-containing protein [Bdellovibrionota bacterium]